MIDKNREESAGQTDRIEQPALIITAERNVVLRPEMAEGMTTWMPNLRKTVMSRVPVTGPAEKPAEVNAAILEFFSIEAVAVTEAAAEKRVATF